MEYRHCRLIDVDHVEIKRVQDVSIVKNLNPAVLVEVGRILIVPCAPHNRVNLCFIIAHKCHCHPFNTEIQRNEH